MRIIGRPVIGRVAIIFLLALALRPGLVLAGDAAVPVAVDAVVVEPLSQTVPVLGRFVARQSGAVAALVGGPVAEVLVEVGDRVRAQDVLVRLATDVSEGNRNLRAAELREKEAALATAQAQARLSDMELARLESLKNSAAFSQARYEDKRAEVARFRSSVVEAEAAIARARANLDLAELDVRRSEIRAPYGGVVVTLHTVDGAYVTTGAPVATLVNDEDLEIEADVSADRLAGVTPGREIAGYLEGGVSFPVVVRAVVPTENALTHTRPVRFTPNLDQAGQRRFATDQSVTVLLPIGEDRDVVTVHKDAVVVRGGNSVTFVVVDGKAEPRPVTLGEAVGGRFEVLDGLVPGDLVVVRGNERLRPGQPVTYEGMPPAPGGNG